VPLADRQTRADTAREPVRAAPDLAKPKPIAIVDIGSNSVRLVIYDGAWRKAAMLHNEKLICAIGRNMVRTGRLDQAGIDMAVEALARFRQLNIGHGVGEIEAVATAAARDADNGAAFVAQAERILGAPIKVLSGEDEARIAAEGVIAGIPGADGLAADLGGGSLDMVTIDSGRIGSATTLPFGPLRLMDLSDGNLNKARHTVEKGLERQGFGKSLKGRSLYAVGGAWRALAHLDMEYQNYPLRVLHHYVMPAQRAIKICRLVSGLSRKSLERMKAVPKRRAEALPYGALVMEQMIETLGLKEVVISAHGLREGVLHRKLPALEAEKDPLIEFARDCDLRESRVPFHAEEIFAWIAPLFAKETAAEHRIRQAVCLMSDTGWRRHPDDRALGTFAHVLRAPYAGADHRERVFMAASIWHRYAAKNPFPDQGPLGTIIGNAEADRALALGLALRLAYGVAGTVEGQLPLIGLGLAGGTIQLNVPKNRQALLGEGVTKRLDDLADVLGRKGQIIVE